MPIAGRPLQIVDDADIATRNDAVFTRVAMINRRAACAEGGEIEMYCIDCGALIPERRREACRQNGLPCLRCAACQGRSETERRQ